MGNLNISYLIEHVFEGHYGKFKGQTIMFIKLKLCIMPRPINNDLNFN